MWNLSDRRETNGYLGARAHVPDTYTCLSGTLPAQAHICFSEASYLELTSIPPKLKLQRDSRSIALDRDRPRRSAFSVYLIYLLFCMESFGWSSLSHVEVASSGIRLMSDCSGNSGTCVWHRASSLVTVRDSTGLGLIV